MVDYGKLALHANSAEEYNKAAIEKRQKEQSDFFRQLGIEILREIDTANKALKRAELQLFGHPMIGDGFILLTRENGQACRLVQQFRPEGIDVFTTADYPSNQAEGLRERTLYFSFDMRKSCLSVKRLKQQWRDYEDLPNVGPAQLAQSIVAMIVGARLVDKFGYKTDEWEWKLV